MTQAQLTRKLTGLPEFLTKALNRSLTDLAPMIVDMNVYQMERKGEDSRGSKFGDYSAASYDAGYPQLKAAMGREGGFINLHNDGDFHGAMDVRVGRDGIEIFSTDPKTDKLVKRYGIDIFGLNDSHMDILVNEVFEKLADEITIYFT